MTNLKRNADILTATLLKSVSGYMILMLYNKT